MAAYSTSKSKAPAKRYQDELNGIKKNIETSYLGFKHNYDRYNEFRRFVFSSSLTDDDVTILDEIGKPLLEFNILEAYVSRLRGEFSKQEPSIAVSMADGVENVDPQMINLLEWHLRACLGAAHNDNLAYKVYTDLLSGGFSVIKIFTEYANEMSFEQNIKLMRCYDPTLCGFDLLATESHKGDGEYCFELYPMRKEEIARKYGNDIADRLSYSRNIDGFSWSYQDNREKIAMVGDYYKKKYKKGKIVQVVDNGTMTTDDYDKFVAKWEADTTKIEQVPAVIGKSRNSEFCTICRYHVIENDIVDYEETPFKDLPLIFIDGNSIDIRKDDSTASSQMTRPYVYHAKGIQKLKNFSGQTLAAWMENMIMHKWLAAVEAVPEAYQDAYMYPQKANVLLFNAFKRDDPTVPLPPPREIVVAPVPPEVTSTFDVTDKMTQVILGSYDASLGINDNQLSGIAIQEGATQSNATAMPYVVGYLNGLNQAAKMYLDLFPKIYVTPRTIPILTPDGKKSFVKINGKNGIPMDYQPNALQVKVEAGASFAIQKNKALMQLEALMKVSPQFAQFMNSVGLPVLLDNLEIRGIDQLKSMLDGYLKQQNQQQQQQQQLAQANSPAALKEMELAQKDKSDQLNAQLQSDKTAIDKQDADTNLLATLSKIGEAKDEALVKRDKASAEEYRASVDLALKETDMRHDHAMDILGHHHTINQEKDNGKTNDSQTQKNT